MKALILLLLICGLSGAEQRYLSTNLATERLPGVPQELQGTWVVEVSNLLQPQFSVHAPSLLGFQVWPREISSPGGHFIPAGAVMHVTKAAQGLDHQGVRLVMLWLEDGNILAMREHAHNIAGRNIAWIGMHGRREADGRYALSARGFAFNVRP